MEKTFHWRDICESQPAPGETCLVYQGKEGLGQIANIKIGRWSPQVHLNPWWGTFLTDSEYIITDNTTGSIYWSYLPMAPYEVLLSRAARHFSTTIDHADPKNKFVVRENGLIKIESFSHLSDAVRYAMKRKTEGVEKVTLGYEDELQDGVTILAMEF